MAAIYHRRVQVNERNEPTTQLNESASQEEKRRQPLFRILLLISLHDVLN